MDIFTIVQKISIYNYILNNIENPAALHTENSFIFISLI